MTCRRGESARLRAHRTLACVLFASVLLGCGDDSDGGEPFPPDAGEDAAADAALGDAANAPGAPQPVSYSADVKPILDAKCNDCHHPGNATKVDLVDLFDPEVGAINRPSLWESPSSPLIIEPGHPERSFLVEKIIGTDLVDHEGSPMPWLLPRLSEEEIATLETWISDGALDDDLYREEVVLIFGDGMSLGSRSGHCAFCHYEGGSLPPNLMNPFDPDTGAVGRRGVYGRVLIEPGDPENSFLMEKVRGTPSVGQQMPLWHDAVTDDELATIERWIAEGALDN